MKDYKWGLGLLIMCIGGVLYPVSLGIGPITLTTALVLSSIPFNMLLSYYLLNDVPSVLVLLSSIVVCISLGFTIAYAPEPSDWKLEDDTSMWRSPEFILWTLSLLGLLMIFWCSNKCLCGALDSIYGFKIATTMIEKGVCSAYVALLAKLTFMSIDQGDDDRTQVYLPIFLVLSVVPLEFPLRQRCLACTDMTKALPTMVVCVMLFAVPTGGIFFHEFKDLEAGQSAFFGSLMVAAICVLVMNWCDNIVQVISPEAEEDHGLSSSRCMPKSLRNLSKFTIPGLGGRSKSSMHDSSNRGYSGVVGTDDAQYAGCEVELQPANQLSELERTEIETCVTEGQPDPVEDSTEQDTLVQEESRESSDSPL